MGRKRKSISIDDKILAIDWIEKHGDGKASRAERYFKSLGWEISSSTFRKWWRDRESIRSNKGRKARKLGGGRKPSLGYIEEIVAGEIIERRIRKEKVTRAQISEIAIAIAASEGFEDESFEASPKWVTSFMKRHNFSLRSTTNLTTLTDDILLDRAYEYMKYLTSLRRSLDPEVTILMDETACYFEDPRLHTVDMTGAKHVVVKSTGFASMRITVVLAVSASGHKLPPHLIWKNKTQSQIRRVGPVYVADQPKAWVNKELICEWLKQVFPVVFDRPGKTIVWDSMRAHLAGDVKAYLKSRNIQQCVIPGGLTAYLQAGDLGIYKSWKDKISPLIDSWKKSDSVQYTRGGNPKPPSVEIVCRWVMQAWRAVPSDVVTKSILAAGFCDEYEEWYISKHDVYGAQFKNIWASNFNEVLEENNPLLVEEADDPVVISQ